MLVYLEKCCTYDVGMIERVLLSWRNTFEQVVSRGDTVVIKPNWIAESHKYHEEEWLPVITHPHLITAVLTVVLERLEGSGKVIITDAPQTSSNWARIMQRMHPELWIEMGKAKNVEVSVIDLREDEWVTKGGFTVDRKRLPGDPKGSTVCNLAEYSEFRNKHTTSAKGFFGADYDAVETNAAHASGNHLYKVSRSVLDADVFINLPKLKTHKKAGITASLKNIVGINTYKNWLPHYTQGVPTEGGDEYPESGLRVLAEASISRVLYEKVLRKPSRAVLFTPIKKVAKLLLGDARTTVRSGNWYGNDTLWRTILDLNRILLYANGEGGLRSGSHKNRKRYLSIVDAIICGEGNGPESPDQKPAGFLLMGVDPASVDAVCAKLMGFDWKKIPSIRNAFSVSSYRIADCEHDEICISSSVREYDRKLCELSPRDLLRFNPSVGWRGEIEAKYD